MLRTLLAVLVVKTSGRIHPVGIELPLPSDESETIHECIRALEEDATVAFSADMIESNDPDYSWASQGIDVLIYMKLSLALTLTLTLTP